MPGGFVRTFVFYIVRKEKHPTDPKKNKTTLSIHELINNPVSAFKYIGSVTFYSFGSHGHLTEIKNYLCNHKIIDQKFLEPEYLKYLPGDHEKFGFRIFKI